ncbi:Protein Wnt-5a [Cichlidogyrus casuarinus]|uniref:Protein Wnt n=1 Tax=Cichlidogyrus casuarinus TaxID=1844966 RepID=A0ABD2Q7G8_9PLAT
MIAPKPLCLRETGLSHSQIRLCQRHFDHMPVISVGAKIGIEECHERFKFRQWNCSSIGESVAFGPEINIGSREAGFAHAISAAGVVHALARSCKESRLKSCSCGNDERPTQLHRDWIWGGCGDNIKYGYQFAKKFIDIRETEKSASLQSVYRSAHVSCKCHGISGSCSLRTCWTQLAPFSKVGQYLQDKYDSSIQVGFNRPGTMLKRSRRDAPRITSEDLIYLEDSPDYCRMDQVTGKTATSGRECLLDGSSSESCESLCCGRGFLTHSRIVSEKCHCRFHWCCEVECQTCQRVERYHICN